MLRILPWGCILKVAKVVIRSAAIEMVHLPLFCRWWLAKKGASNKPMDVDILEIDLDHSIT